MGPYLIYSHSIPYKQGAIPIKQGESAAFKVEWEKVTHKKNPQIHDRLRKKCWLIFCSWSSFYLHFDVLPWLVNDLCSLWNFGVRFAVIIIILQPNLNF